MRTTGVGLMAGLLAVTPAGGATYFMAPGGSDAAAGTKDAPFATVVRAQQAVKPGDTVVVGGGTYKMAEAQAARRGRGRMQVIVLDKSGSEGKPVTYQAADGDPPVFDFSAVKPAGSRVAALFVEGSWIHLKGLEITGVQVTQTRHTQSECVVNQGSHNVYEALKMHDGQAIGFWLGGGSDNLVLNCDAWRNHDFTSENKMGGNVDGFGFHVQKGSVGNVFRGCRAWFNSDDGFDFINTAESVTVENCWAFYNGLSADFKRLGDGNGFKAGGYAGTPVERMPSPVPRHTIRGCLAVGNRASGFYANHQPGGNDWFNNTAWKNTTNYNMLGRNAENSADLPGYGHKMRNNLGFAPLHAELASLNKEASDVGGNSFNLPVTVTAEDFLGLDAADLTAPRQPNGDLPKVALLHLAPGSDLIDKGVDAGLPFRGKAPDLGAFESGQ